MGKIKVGIIGYGNLGKGVEIAIKKSSDMELVGIWTRRDPETLETKSRTYSLDTILDFKDKIDVCILCGGSATDLVQQGPEISKNFNTVDSYDNHKEIPNYFEKVNKSATENDKLALISSGWDPGLFSINRLIGESILPEGKTYSFWGSGVSQGHSDAVRRVEGVKTATQYTIPKEDVIKEIRAGKDIELAVCDGHLRECHVVLNEGACKEKVKDMIVNMPGYFDEYETKVEFIDMEEFNKRECGMPHGGRIMRLGKTSKDHNQVYEFALNLDNNPEFTASVLVAYSRAVYRMFNEGERGAITVFDIAPKYLSEKTDEELRKKLL